MADNVRAELESHLKDIRQIQTEILKSEKKAWEKHEEVDQKGQKMLERVRKRLGDQVGITNGQFRCFF